jgi:hypothetical protein
MGVIRFELLAGSRPLTVNPAMVLFWALTTASVEFNQPPNGHFDAPCNAIATHIGKGPRIALKISAIVAIGTGGRRLAMPIEARVLRCNRHGFEKIPRVLTGRLYDGCL